MCQLCGLRSNNLVTHIIRTHNISCSEYKLQFSGYKVSQLSTEQAEKINRRRRKKETKHSLYRLETKRRQVETLAAGMLMLKCRLCEFETANSLISHITRKHKIMMNEYRENYPNDIVQQNSPTQNHNHSKAMRKRLSDPIKKEKFLEWRSFPSEIKHWTRKGFSLEEAQEKVRKFQVAQSLKGNNEITREKRSKKNTGDNNPMSLSSIAKREAVTIQEAKKLTPCHGRLGKLHPMFGKKHTYEALIKIAAAPHLSNPDYRSIPERQLEEKCLGIGKLLHNHRIHKWNVDILFCDKPIIVELFGDYWHMNPRKYKLTDVHNLMNKTANEIWERDTKKLQDLREQGYEVIVIWETDWRNDSEECIERIKNAYNRIL